MNPKSKLPAKEPGKHVNIERILYTAFLSVSLEQKKKVVKILANACDFGYYNRQMQWHIFDGTKSILRTLAYFETGCFEQYSYEMNELLSEESCLWYDLWEFEDCVKLDRIKLFKNGRMDIRLTSEQYARQFVTDYLGTVY